MGTTTLLDFSGKHARMRAAEQAERQLEAQQRRGGRRPVAQPAPRADTVDQLAVGVQRASRGTAAPGSSACRFCQPGHLEILTHAFLTCTAVAPAWEWVLDVYGHLTGTRPPSGNAMLLLNRRPTRGEAPPFLPLDSLLWLRLRVAYMGAVWRLLSSGAATALQPHQVARRVVEEVISTLTTAVKRDWHRVGRDIRVGLCSAVPSTWFEGKDPELDAAHFDQLWPEASGGEAAFGGAAAAMMAASLPWRPQGLNLLGRVQVAQQCLASKSIYQMAFVQPSAPPAQAMASAVNRFVAASDLPQERSPNSSRLYPSKAICVMPRGKGGVGHQHGHAGEDVGPALVAPDPSHGLSTWVITDPTAPPSRGISPRLQAHVAALAELKLFRAVPPAGQSFFSVLAEPLWYNAQVRMIPAVREEAAEQGWTHVRHVREALHSPELEGEARWAADLVRACLPEPWQGMVDRLQPPQPEWERLRVGPGVGFVMRRTFMLQPSHWVGFNGRLSPLDPTGQGPLGAFWAEEGAAWEPAAVARLNKPSYRLTPEERATHLRPLPAQRHAAQAEEGPGTWPKEEWLLGPWAHLQLDPQVWGMGTTTLLDFSGKHARMRAAEQAERQLEAQQRRGGRRPVAQPAPRADTVDQLAVGVQRASRGTAAPGSSACRFCQPGHLEILTHAFLTCTAVAPAWEWVLDVYGHLTGTRPPSGDAMLLLNRRPTRGEAPPFQPPDSLLWLRLRRSVAPPQLMSRYSPAATSGGGQGQQQGGRQQGEEKEPDVVIPAVRVGVPVRHRGVPLGAASYAATSEAAFGGAAAAMMAASLPWRPQGLNLLGRVQVAQQCLASKSIYQMAFVQPSAPPAQAMASAVNRFVAASDLPQERSPNSSRLYPSKAICVMTRGEGGVGHQHGHAGEDVGPALVAPDPPHGLSTWVITDPTDPPSRGISPRLQAHVAALAELKLFRAVPPAGQSFFSVLAEPLWYNAQVRMNPVAREAATEQGWTHVRHLDPQVWGMGTTTLLDFSVKHARGTAAPGSAARRFCQPGHLEILTHAFLTCTAVAPAWEWVLDVYGHLTGTRPPSGDAMLLLSGRPTRGEAPPFQPPDNLLWLRLRAAYMGAVWRLLSSGAATALQPHEVARRVVEEVISTLTTAVQRDWHRVGRDIRVGLCGAVPSTWFKGKDPELDAAHFDQLWPEASWASGNQATILDDDNWPIWSIRTEGLLIEAGRWSVVADGVTPLPTAPAANATQQEQTAYAAELARSRADSALDRKAKAFIQRHVSNLHIFTVKSADSAQDAWETLESQFTESSVARQSQLQQQLSLLRMEPGESVACFYARLQQLLTELEACNYETSESTVVLAILAALPPEYESTVERLRYDQTSADLKVERIKRVLLTKEADLLSKQMQQQLSTSSSSLWSYSSPSDSRGAGSSGGQGGRGRLRLPQQSREQQSTAQQQQARAQSPDRSTRDVSSHAHLTCNYCAKPGHIMSECFTFDRDQRNRMRTLFSNPARPSSPGRRPSPGRSSSPARTSSPSRGRAHTPGRTAAQSPSRGASLFTCSTAAAADDDDDDDLDDVLMQMVQPRLNFNNDLYSPFCIDSGASQHILKDLQFFYNYTPFAPDKHRPVRLAAEGHRVWAVGSGNVFLSTKRGSWFLSHALYVPDSKQNFISVTAATDDGSSFLFRGDVCQISCNQFGSMLRVNAHKVRNSYILAAIPMPDGPDTDSEQEQLYGIQQSALQPDPRIRLELLTNVAAPSANSATSNSPQVWHQRLCHTSYDALARMQSAGMVSGVPVTAAQFRAAASDPAVCVGCVKGKQHKNVAFAGPPPNAALVTAPLGLIHMDVCGPMHARARDGSLYVATFLDEHTKLSVCVPISSKAQVPDTVRTVIEELETQSGYRCKAIRTDNGTEYVNSRMREYCASKGIVHQHSAPYSPQQNGAAERLNRTIFEKARNIIHSADISLSFWAHAVKFSNHVRCLLPVSGQPLTPWEAFYGVKPDLSGLRVFGCRVWLHVPDHQRSKLQAKSVEGLFIGYEPGSKAYRVLVNGRETCSKNIVFDELSVLQPTRQHEQPAQPVFLLPLPPSPNTPSETLSPAAPAEGGNSLQQTSSSSSEDSGSSSSISRPGSSAQRPQSRPLEGIGAHQDSSSSDSPPSEQEPSQQVSLTARYEPGSHMWHQQQLDLISKGDSGSKTNSTSSCSISSTSSSKASSTSRSISSTSSCSISSTSSCKTCSISSSKASITNCSITLRLPRCSPTAPALQPCGSRAAALRLPRCSPTAPALQPCGSRAAALRLPRCSLAAPALQLLAPALQPYGSRAAAMRLPRCSLAAPALQPCGSRAAALRLPRCSLAAPALQPCGSRAAALRLPRCSHAAPALQPCGSHAAAISSRAAAMRLPRCSLTAPALQPYGSRAAALRLPRCSLAAPALQPYGSRAAAMRLPRCSLAAPALQPCGSRAAAISSRAAAIYVAPALQPYGSRAAALRLPRCSLAAPALQPYGSRAAAMRLPRCSLAAPALQPYGSRAAAMRLPRCSLTAPALQPCGSRAAALRLPRCSLAAPALQLLAPALQLCVSRAAALRLPRCSLAAPALQPCSSCAAALRLPRCSHVSPALQPYGSRAAALQLPRCSPTAPALQPCGSRAVAMWLPRCSHVAIAQPYGSRAVAIGSRAVAIGSRAVAIGSRAVAIGSRAVAIGSRAVAIGSRAVAIGSRAVVIGSRAVAIGSRAVAIGSREVAIGSRAVAIGSRAVAIGSRAVAIGSRAVAIGSRAVAIGSRAVAIGSRAVAIGSRAVAIGSRAVAIGSRAVAIGSRAVAIGSRAVAIGSRAETTGFAQKPLAPAQKPPAPAQKPPAPAQKPLAPAQVTLLIYSPINDTPTVAEALAGPMADLWIEAMNAELASLHANQTWCLEERPANARVLPTKWVLKVKRDAAGNIEKLKARLVAKGATAWRCLTASPDVGDVYAPVSKHTTLRTLLAKAAAENMEIHQLDFETAFLNGKLEPGEVIYVQQPEGFEEGSTNTVCRLQKALYGFRQAPRAWHARLCEELLSMGFKASEADPALFTLQLSTGMVYLLVYVDDCLLCTQQGDTAGLAYVKKQLSSAFKLKDLGEARWFLGMQLTRDRTEGTIKLDQHKFIQELVTANSKSAAHSKPLPMAPAVKLVREGDALDTTLHHYSALVGSLLYLTCCTRPDIAFAVGALARHMSAPTKQHWAAACSVLCYLKGTADQGLLFGGVSGLQGFSDADYAGDKDTARSTTGYIFTLNGGAISWSSRLQPTVAMSTAEAEYMAASSAAKEALWLRKLMRDLQLDASCVHLGCDNQAAIQLLHNPMATSRAKHIDVHHHFVRERISRGEVAFHYCHTSSMLADILTKPLAEVQFNMGKQGCRVFS
ncbi:hypothetical protein QJQ45_022318 [Haematococcus lacustris]|nr:hypothetical protein QJQ45_022318 [Haematococcus lacustris]